VWHGRQFLRKRWRNDTHHRKRDASRHCWRRC